MSAKPFWVIFTFFVVILIEWLVVLPIANIVFTKDVASLIMPLDQVDLVYRQNNMDMPEFLQARLEIKTLEERISKTPEGGERVQLESKLRSLNYDLEIKALEDKLAKAHNDASRLQIQEQLDTLKKRQANTPAVITREQLDRLIDEDEEIGIASSKDLGILTAEDLSKLNFRAKWHLLSFRDSAKPWSYVLGLFAAGILAGFLFASVAFRHIINFGDKLSHMSITDIVAILLGFVVGMLLSIVILPLMAAIPGVSENSLVFPVVRLIIIYVCIAGMMSIKEELKVYFPGLSRGSGGIDKEFQKPKIIDTNVIIDGRISDICRSGFIEGQIIIPSFILEELQHIADSADSLRRARGRRGLDILNQMRKELSLVIRQAEPVDAEDQDEVDIRLVKLAKDIDGSIVTNDFNLNKVAELHGVQVLNINELANALKPVALPGEEMTVNIVKEGKEMNQGIAYLDDGTMVVVENGKKHIGETVDVMVASVLQTVAGKMIFTNVRELQDKEDDLIGRNVRNYSSIGPRKKTR